MPSATQVEVRRAGPDDAAVVATVLHASFVEFKALYTEGGFAATALGAGQVLTRMQEGRFGWRCAKAPCWARWPPS
jgi:hypothetical protein